MFPQMAVSMFQLAPRMIDLAEREGFEPPIRLPVCRISSAVHSTALPPLRGAERGVLQKTPRCRIYVTKRSGRDKAGARAAPSPRLRGEGWDEGRNRCRPGNLQKPLTRPRFARSTSPRRRGEVKRAIRTDRVLAAP